MTKTKNPMQTVYDRLHEAGIRRSYVRNVVLPEWWDDEIAETDAGLLQGLGIIARHLGLELLPLYEKRKVEFQSREVVRFNKSAGVSESDLGLAQSIATQALLLTCFQTKKPFNGILESAAQIRLAILSSGDEAVNLKNLLEYCWENGIVVLHVSNFPPGAKKMDALATMHDERPGIVLSKNHQSPSWMVFPLAHDMGHVARGHIKKQGVLVDERIDPASKDAQEQEANRFAIELLTGNPNMHFRAPYYLKAAKLAEAAKSVGHRVKVDPGVVALNYAWQENLFPVANAALKLIEAGVSAIQTVRKAMVEGLKWEDIPETNREYIGKLTGADIQA